MRQSWFRRVTNRCRLFLDRRYNIEIFRQKGVQIGEKTGIQVGCYLDPAYPHLIKIGNHVVLSNNVTILTHDASLDRFLGVCRIGLVEIKDYCFIGINAVIMPNVSIGPCSVVGAGSVVTKDVPPFTVVAGNPATVVCSLEDFINRHELQLQTNPRFPRTYFDSSNPSQQIKDELVSRLRNTTGYLVGSCKKAKNENRPGSNDSGENTIEAFRRLFSH